MCVYLVAYESRSGEETSEKAALSKHFSASMHFLYPGLFLYFGGPYASRVQTETLLALGGGRRSFVARLTDDYDFRQSPSGMSHEDIDLERLLPARKWDAS